MAGRDPSSGGGSSTAPLLPGSCGVPPRSTGERAGAGQGKLGRRSRKARARRGCCRGVPRLLPGVVRLRELAGGAATQLGIWRRQAQRCVSHHQSAARPSRTRPSSRPPSAGAASHRYLRHVRGGHGHGAGMVGGYDMHPPASPHVRLGAVVVPRLAGAPPPAHRRRRRLERAEHDARSHCSRAAPGSLARRRCRRPDRST